MVNFLVQVHAIKGIGLNLSISPPHIPITSAFLILNDPAKFLGNLGYNWVLSVTDVDNNLFVFEFIGEFGDRNDFGAVVSVDYKLLFRIVGVVVVALVVVESPFGFGHRRVKGEVMIIVLSVIIWEIKLFDREMKLNDDNCRNDNKSMI
jgi:hypothetical protein